MAHKYVNTIYMFLLIFSESLLEYAIKILKDYLQKNYEWVLVANEIYFNNTLYNLLLQHREIAHTSPHLLFKLIFVCLVQVLLFDASVKKLY